MYTPIKDMEMVVITSMTVMELVVIASMTVMKLVVVMNAKNDRNTIIEMEK